MQYGSSMRYCGYAHKYDQVIVDGILGEHKFLAFFCLEGKVLAAASSTCFVFFFDLSAQFEPQ